MAEKKRYSDEELEEFKEIINEKIRLARRDYDSMMRQLMNADGNSFDVTPAGGAMTVPFRPYFIAAASPAPAHHRSKVQSILFDNDDSSFAFGDDKDPSGDNFGEGDLVITIRQHAVSVTSSLRREADVRIVNMSGLTIATFTIQPGETIDTNIGVAGVYMVRADGGRIQKKLAIR